MSGKTVERLKRGRRIERQLVSGRGGKQCRRVEWFDGHGGNTSAVSATNLYIRPALHPGRNLGISYSGHQIGSRMLRRRPAQFMTHSLGSPWYRQVTRAQWRAFLATFLGWLLDGFDFTIMTFILIDIQTSFTVDRALAGALGTVTLLFRLVGGLGAGMAADRWGCKLPLMLSILWFPLFAFLSGFSTSYAMLFAFRALFGIGMGGEWAAGMPLALEHWPARYRGLASGLLQGGWYWGYIVSALTFHFVYPLFSGLSDPFSDIPESTLAWRVMFWTGVIPALLVLWIRSGVDESRSGSHDNAT